MLQKQVALTAIAPPPEHERVSRAATFARAGEKRSRYHLPQALDSSSPIGFRTRVSLTEAEASDILSLLSLDRPQRFEPSSAPLREEELFEETAASVLSARQSTNYRGHRDVVFGPEDSARLAHLLRSLRHLDGPVLDHATHTHVVLSRPYRTAFTFLLTFVGHNKWTSALGIGKRALDKKLRHKDDIPTIGYLQHLHLGILADAFDRAALVASGGTRRANVLMAPFCSDARRSENDAIVKALEELCGLSAAERAAGWRVHLVAQVGQVPAAERPALPASTWRKLGANLMAFRSERIQPGVNQDKNAPAPYQQRQTMDVPEEVTVMCGRAAYNAFSFWSGVDRDKAKELVVLERIDVLTDAGKARLREIRTMLEKTTDRVVDSIPKWADALTGFALTRGAALGRKAFGLAGQRIYIGGLHRGEVERAGLSWEQAIRAFGAAASRSSFVAEVTGCVNIPPGCDMLAGTCLMAGPVNQNDVGKTFWGEPDLLESKRAGVTSLLVWTIKAKTVTDPIGNEEQLMSVARKGALVDLRPGPHEVIAIKTAKGFTPLRKAGNRERAFSELDNFARAPDGVEIPRNQGERLEPAARQRPVW